MGNNLFKLTPQELDKIIKRTIKAIENGKNEIYSIAEGARKELERIQRELKQINKEIKEVIAAVDSLAVKEKMARKRLMEVDRDFHLYTEEDIKAAYEEAREYQVKLLMMREREKQLITKRMELKRSYKNLETTLQKAENLISQIGVVLDFIGGNLKDISAQLETIQQKQQFGLQIIRAQEEERRRVAREIHDGPAQSLANVILRVEFCEKLLEVNELGKLKAELQDLKNIVRRNLQDVRKIIFDLRPMALDDLGFIPAIKRYVADFSEKNGLPVKITIYGEEKRLKPAMEVALFRLVQESLNNVLKHAKATEVNLVIRMGDKDVAVVVKDNGVGFDLEKVMEEKKGKSFGLIGMRERVEMLEGKLEIKTAPGKGTEVWILIPIKSGGEEGGEN